MKVKTSVTLSKELLELIEKNREASENRSAFIESAVVYYLQHYQKKIRESRDLEILNRQYSKLNKEAEEVLQYQDLQP
jgi:metal-responsive CopG/Arc/MetJ family transcriptional regulator